jgi:hypothetical protein
MSSLSWSNSLSDTSMVFGLIIASPVARRTPDKLLGEL